MKNQVWMALSLSAVALVGCGKKERRSGPAKSTASSASCIKVQKRNQTCLDSLVDMAQQKSKILMAGTVARLPEPQRSQVEARMQSVLAGRRDALQNVLRQSLGKPFMHWCVAASQSASGKRQVDRLTACLAKPDCRAYAQCVGQLLDVGASKSPKAAQPPVGSQPVVGSSMTPAGQGDPSGMARPAIARPTVAAPRSARPATARPVTTRARGPRGSGMASPSR